MVHFWLRLKESIGFGTTARRPTHLSQFRWTPSDRVEGALQDAEALTRTRDGSFLVAFEGVHRIWHYSAPPDTFESIPMDSFRSGRGSFARCGGIDADARWFISGCV